MSSAGAKASVQILIADDDPNIRDGLRTILEREGYPTLEAGDGRAALQLLEEKEDVGLLLLDPELQRVSGMEVLEYVAEHRPDLPVVIMKGTGSTSTAVQTVRLGVSDFLEHPMDARRTLQTVRAALERATHRGREGQERAETVERYGMVGRSGAMRTIFDVIDGAASLDVPVVITGERGTSKETVARAIHRNGPRAERPFVTIDCTAVTDSDLERELSRPARGAVTGGSLFLDEVAQLGSAAQATLLRALEAEASEDVGDEGSGPGNVRIIAATRRDLADDVAAGRFRKDLYSRLNVVSIPIPPLRTRPDDIPDLLEHFLDLRAIAGARPRLSTAALSMLLHHEWPGNVRELRDAVDRMLFIAGGAEITGDVASQALRRQ